MANLSLAQIADLDCVVSFSPLVLDLPRAEVYARGPSAIVRRVLYVWAVPLRVPAGSTSGGGLLQLPGRTLSQGDVASYRNRFARLAEGVDYVTGAQVVITPGANGELAIAATLTLTDGQTYPLEVATSAAGAAIRALG